MSKTTDLQVRCLHCRTWFKSQIRMLTREAFDTATLFGNLQQCPHCGKMTASNKENFNAKFEDGGFMGVDTV